ncbi:hypothetical protein TNCV_3335741 [Trichonephila clavipes]|nr:hypothetical protein TNCV_3335741 [Trichonephila clavipes]
MHRSPTRYGTSPELIKRRRRVPSRLNLKRTLYMESLRWQLSLDSRCNGEEYVTMTTGPQLSSVQYSDITVIVKT